MTKKKANGTSRTAELVGGKDWDGSSESLFDCMIHGLVPDVASGAIKPKQGNTIRGAIGTAVAIAVNADDIDQMNERAATRREEREAQEKEIATLRGRLAELEPAGAGNGRRTPQKG